MVIFSEQRQLVFYPVKQCQLMPVSSTPAVSRSFCRIMCVMAQLAQGSEVFRTVVFNVMVHMCNAENNKASGDRVYGVICYTAVRICRRSFAAVARSFQDRRSDLCQPVFRVLSVITRHFRSPMGTDTEKICLETLFCLL